MIVNKVICDRCGDEVNGGTHPPRLVKQTWVKSEKVTVANGYRNADTIHLCEECSKHFEEFMHYER